MGKDGAPLYSGGHPINEYTNTSEPQGLIRRLSIVLIRFIV